MAATLTAEQMNAARRAAKARQQAVAKAKAAGKGTNTGEFSLSEAVKEQRLHHARKEFAEKRAKENGDKLLAEVIRLRVLKLDKPEGDDWTQSVKFWKFNCFDVIAAAKRSDQRFTWNRDWLETGRLLIAPNK